MADIAPGRDDEVQVIAVARLCTPSGGGLSTQYREATDHLDEVEWATPADVVARDVIPSLRPAFGRFLKMIATDDSVSQ